MRVFASSQRSGQRAANIMSLIQSAKINGLDPHAYLRDVLERLPTTKYFDIDNLLLPHNLESLHQGVITGRLRTISR